MRQVLGGILVADDQLFGPVPDATSITKVVVVQSFSNVSFLNLINEIMVDNLRAKLGSEGRELKKGGCWDFESRFPSGCLY